MDYRTEYVKAVTINTSLDFNRKMLDIVGKDNFSFEPTYLNLVRFTYIELKNFIDNQRFQFFWKDNSDMVDAWDCIKPYIDDISAIRNAMCGHLDDIAIEQLIAETPEGFRENIPLDSQRIMISFGLLESCINHKCNLHNHLYENESFSVYYVPDQRAFITFTLKLIDTVLLLSEYIISTVGPIVNKENANLIISQLIESEI
ncbi:putative uncharacterized protein [Aliivibrio wodanis]|uniref:Uncharacterized protein n=1 Tax=Aliivibrio wodanis TaxID=80852 RepID=A0A090ICN9_9GAMM|nr:putative uncharacterized protein [Aliivibrio wodanis]